ncbi:anti-anti-sigma factor [Micromonospora phaseoli]|uniref:Anti-anti-sigma factor n=1 Tax=Micromonospora phaseoli TaxID=1144548 RepID=A0A1H7C1Q3_9ACTN|nr:STAS domain-containing protein [Micromonospora phaseoli]PZV92686.1 anti-anti-sigma factor [Micromonospora phaseoli]GIJ76660.1 hypothetical protein Xph01_10920 [Micromonospora phaseoli]SEJ83386.1 anti-anti-sigma factor [Micromonospora phaseoli]
MDQRSGDNFSITLLAAPGATTALVCLAGEIDLTANSALADVVDRLSTIAPTEVVVDVAEVTFACSTLPNFLARMHLNLPNRSALVVCRPTTNVQRLLDLTDMGQIVTLRDDLPTSGSWAPRRTSPATTAAHEPLLGGR